ncbi:fatty acid desaturase [Rhizobiaceae bacterium]|nr:fatty acid desaturase [Rhizobiaceae bacterium]
MQDDHKVWSRRLAAYKLPDSGRGIFELAVTLLPYAALWALAAATYSVSIWLTFLIALPAGILLVRLFALQHDCGHYALFPDKSVNDWVGRGLGVLTYTPYDDWRREHALHHAGSGNLERRGIGDVDTLTVREYRARGWLGRTLYRAYRNPLVLFIMGPAYQFLFRHRFPTGDTRTAMPIWSAVTTNAGILLLSLLLIWAVGWQAFLAVQIPFVIVAATIGVWLFYVQHQFDETHWDEPQEWQREHAALHGSSFYDLPKPLMWLTANIGIHHVHHISAQIPFHRLPQVLRDFPELKQIGRLTFWESLRCIPLALWCEERRELVSFRRARQPVPVAA